MSRHDDRIVTWAVGKGKNLAKAENKKGAWSTVRKLLRTTLRTGERYKEYMKLSRDEQLRLKSTNGWISGAQCDGEWRNLRNVRPRDLMTLDLDHPDDDFWDIHSMEYHWVSQFESIAITTRSHGPSNQRYRMVLPMSRMVTPDEYGPLVRIMSLRIDGHEAGADLSEVRMKQVDVVSSRRAQMMFLPTTSKDGEFKVAEVEGSLLDPDALFDWFEQNFGDWRDLANLPRYVGEDVLRRHADKAEDPWLKPGMIGNWCRAYPIEDAIAEFLSDVYVPGDAGSGKPRYTYTGGSASNGAVVEDDGRFLYSHHGTDPVGETLVNAWDLIRIHLFGMKDGAGDQEKPIGERPSTKAMQEFAKADKRYMEKVVESRYDTAAMFDDADMADVDEEEDLDVGSEYTEAEATEDQGFSEDDLPPEDGSARESSSGSAGAAPRSPKPGKKRINPRAKTWFGEELEIDQNGNIKSNIHNVAAILYNDPRFYDAIRYDLFSGQVRLFHDIKSKTENVPNLIVQDREYGDRWQEIGHITIRAILATPNGAGKVGYGLGTVAERDIAGAVLLCALRNSYHPVKDFMESVPWDGVERVENLFIRYLGVPDTAYARETARLVLVASVARIYEPGHKFDFAPVLQGDQGIRKSSFIEALYGVRWFGEINCKLDETQKIAETIGGKWGMEFPELAAFRRTDHNDAKQFMSARDDTVRMAYAREVSVIKRQTVFWGSTNDETYLKDPTGNRRWWPQIVRVVTIDTPDLMANRQQIWAEARAIYVAMREQDPAVQDLPLFLSPAATVEAKRLQEGAREHGLMESWVREIEAWAEQPVRLQAFATHYGKDPASFVAKGVNPDDVWVRRTVWCAGDAAELALGLDWPAKNDLHVKTLDRTIKALTVWSPDQGGERYRRWGSEKKAWYARFGETPEDIDRGFVVTDAPEFQEAEFTDHGFTDDDLGPDPDDTGLV
jgi:putative DNA primase/helicase